jgi:integrase
LRTIKSLLEYVRARGKYVLVFSILRDTGMRPIELERTRTRDIDLEKGTITVRTAKGRAGRTVQLRKQTQALLRECARKILSLNL